jgi:hypothetical protein
MCLTVVAVAGGGQVHTIAGSMESDGWSQRGQCRGSLNAL